MNGVETLGVNCVSLTVYQCKFYKAPRYEEQYIVKYPVPRHFGHRVNTFSVNVLRFSRV